VTYPCPAHIRELQNAIERALIVSDAAHHAHSSELPCRGLPSLPGVATPSAVANQDAAAATTFKSSSDTRSRMPSRRPRQQDSGGGRARDHPDALYKKLKRTRAARSVVPPCSLYVGHRYRSIQSVCVIRRSFSVTPVRDSRAARVLHEARIA